MRVQISLLPQTVYLCFHGGFFLSVLPHTVVIQDVVFYFTNHKTIYIYMKKAIFILTALFSIIFFRWIVYMDYLEKSLKSKKNNEISQVIDTVYIDSWNIDLIFYADSIGNMNCNDSLVVSFLNKIDIENKHIVYAQMRLESGNYKSNLAKNNNNYFGMKQPYNRRTLSIGKTNGYATYKSWVHSIIDYALWQKKYAYNLSEQEYYEKLSSYASDEDYINKVKQISKTYYEKVKN